LGQERGAQTISTLSFKRTPQKEIRQNIQIRKYLKTNLRDLHSQTGGWAWPGSWVWRASLVKFQTLNGDNCVSWKLPFCYIELNGFWQDCKIVRAGKDKAKSRYLKKVSFLLRFGKVINRQTNLLYGAKAVLLRQCDI